MMLGAKDAMDIVGHGFRLHLHIRVDHKVIKSFMCRHIVANDL